MSFKLTVQAFEARVGNPLRKLILIKLADQANDQGVCWPSYETIAHHCEAGRRSVINHIKQLEKDGFLRIEKTYDKETKQNKSNRYHLTIEQGNIGKGGSANNAPGVVQYLHQGSANDALGVVQDLHQGSAKFAPKPIIEPINIEPINETNNKEAETEIKKCAENSFKKQAEELVDFWNDNHGKPKSANIKPSVWIDTLKTRLKKFSVEEIQIAMLGVIQSNWHRENGQVLIKNAISSDKRCDDSISRYYQLNEKNQGNNYANNQSANQTANQPASHFDQLRQELELKYGEHGYTDNGIKTVN